MAGADAGIRAAGGAIRSGGHGARHETRAEIVAFSCRAGLHIPPLRRAQKDQAYVRPKGPTLQPSRGRNRYPDC